jgi:hypothetical protein
MRARVEYQSKLGQSPWNHFSYFNKRMYADADIQSAQRAENSISPYYPNRSPSHLFIDFSAPVFFNPLRYPKTCVSVAWDNLSPQGKYCSTPIDFIVLDTKDAIGSKPEPEFNQRIKQADRKLADGYRADRASRRALNTTGQFAGQTFKHLGDFGRLRVYKAATLSNTSSNTP